MTTLAEAREEMRSEFLRIATERLEQINVLWIALESDRCNPEAAAKLLRELHTLKGESKMMEMATVNGLVHRIEGLALAVKLHGFEVSEPVRDLFLEACDATNSAVHGRDTDATGLIERLRRATEELTGARAATPVADLAVVGGGQPPSNPAAAPGAVAPTSAGPTVEAPGESSGHSMAQPDVADRFLRVDADLVSAFSDAATENLVDLARYESLIGQLRGMRTDIAAAVSHLAASPHRADRGGLAAYEEQRLAAVAVLEELHRRLDDATGSLRERVDEGLVHSRELDFRARRLRLVTIASVLERFVRPTRNLAREHGKEVHVDIDADGVSIDRSVAERLAEPLLHLVRNAVDHGIESPGERERGGKPAAGRILLRAEKQGGGVGLTVGDDGRGIDWPMIKRRAVELGIVNEEESARLQDEETFGLVFYPGYSTRVAASETSGRGLGLDVVKRTVELLGGNVSVRSELGKGTRFLLRVPVDVTLTRVLVLPCADGVYALPAASVASVRYLESEKSEILESRRALRLDGIPVFVASMDSMTDSVSDGAEMVAVFLEHNGAFAAVTTARAPREHDVMIKPLGPLFASTRLAAGACLLEDGSLAIVLSAAEVVSRVLGGLHRVAAPVVAATPEADRRCVLLVEDSSITRAMVAGILASLGYRVEEAEDGVQALAVLASKRVDLVLTDIDMPKMDGVELSRRIRQSADWKGLPIVVLSTRGSDEDKRRALTAGADSYVVKSEFSEGVLREALSRGTGGARRPV